jgi:outer membrane immunogenic protein
MKKLALSVAALAVSAGAALAADLPSRKGPAVLPPPPPPPPMWTGFYVGLNAGGAWANSNTVNTGAAGLFAAPTWETELAASAALATGQNSANNSGFIGGGQIGYNYQFYNNFLVGIEADIQGIAGSGSSSSRSGALVPAAFPGETIVSTVSASRSLDYLGTVRGRLGWLATPTLLLYGTGGLAYGGVSASTSIFQANLPFTPPFAAGGAFSDTQVGWTAGGGVEWMFWPNWSAKAEYLYYDLGTVNYSAGALGFNPAALLYASAVASSARFNGNIVRAGVNYHFNWGAPAPVVAKY